MGKKLFFTEDFYDDPQITLDIMNELVTKKLVYDKDMYASGTFLYMEVYDNEIVREILTKVIDDLEAYKVYNSESFSINNNLQIDLSSLQDEHKTYFGDDKEIMWSHETKKFVFSENL